MAVYFFCLLVFVVFILPMLFNLHKVNKPSVDAAQRILAALFALTTEYNVKYVAQTRHLLEVFYSSMWNIGNKGVNGWDDLFIDGIFSLRKKGAKILAGDFEQLRKSTDLSFKKAFVELLFKLSAVNDGIRKNEWKFILLSMQKLGLNNKQVRYFLKKYAPLRVEEEENYYSKYYEKEEKQTYQKSSSSLKPYFSVLGLPENASKAQLQSQYHKLALQYHPDLGKNHEHQDECTKKMAQINEAYAHLMARL